MRWWSRSTLVLVVLLCSCSTAHAGPVGEQWAKPGSTATCLTEKGGGGIRYSVQAFYPPDSGTLTLEKVELPAGASNVRILGVKAVQNPDVLLGSGYGWPKDVDPMVNKDFKPETWVDLAQFKPGPRDKGQVQVFVGIQRIDTKTPGILPGVSLTYKIDSTTYTDPSVEYMLIDKATACTAENWRKALPSAK